MSKELFISSSPHETKVAVLEDDELVEVYHERDTGWALVGSIYKGRVTRVLPGMQSAFVDIGLERDAFLYVSDFFEDSEEYERVVSEAEARVGRVTAAETAAPAMAEVSRGGVEPATGEAGGTSTTSSAPEASVVRPEPESAEIHDSSAEEAVSGERVAPPRGSESPGAPSG